LTDSATVDSVNHITILNPSSTYVDKLGEGRLRAIIYVFSLFFNGRLCNGPNIILFYCRIIAVITRGNIGILMYEICDIVFVISILYYTFLTIINVMVSKSTIAAMNKV